MKKIYLTLLFLVCTLVVSGQEMIEITSVQNPESNNFTLYPNPAFDDIVYVTTKKNVPKDITVYDVFGKIVLRDRISTNELNISQLVPGIYVLQVQEKNKTMTRKLVVK